MTKWSEMLARIIPWFDTDNDDGRQLRENAAAVSREQCDLAPLIDAQTDYLVTKGELNGFSRQLQQGFRRKLVGE